MGNHSNLKNQINHSSDDKCEKLSELGFIRLKDCKDSNAIRDIIGISKIIAHTMNELEAKAPLFAIFKPDFISSSG